MCVASANLTQRHELENLYRSDRNFRIYNVLITILLVFLGHTPMWGGEVGGGGHDSEK